MLSTIIIGLSVWTLASIPLGIVLGRLLARTCGDTAADSTSVQPDDTCRAVDLGYARPRNLRLDAHARAETEREQFAV